MVPARQSLLLTRLMSRGRLLCSDFVSVEKIRLRYQGEQDVSYQRVPGSSRGAPTKFFKHLAVDP
jgi:hypothetical protein